MYWPLLSNLSHFYCDYNILILIYKTYLKPEACQNFVQSCIIFNLVMQAESILSKAEVNLQH